MVSKPVWALAAAVWGIVFVRFLLGGDVSDVTIGAALLCVALGALEKALPSDI